MPFVDMATYTRDGGKTVVGAFSVFSTLPDDAPTATTREPGANPMVTTRVLSLEQGGFEIAVFSTLADPSEAQASSTVKITSASPAKSPALTTFDSAIGTAQRSGDPSTLSTVTSDLNTLSATATPTSIPIHNSPQASEIALSSGAILAVVAASVFVMVGFAMLIRWCRRRRRSRDDVEPVAEEPIRHDVFEPENPSLVADGRVQGDTVSTGNGAAERPRFSYEMDEFDVRSGTDEPEARTAELFG